MQKCAKQAHKIFKLQNFQIQILKRNDYFKIGKYKDCMNFLILNSKAVKNFAELYIMWKKRFIF